MVKAEAHYKKMVETPVPKLILMLGIPTTLSMLITNIYNLVDTTFVGTLGESAQGAMGVVFTLMGILQALAFMLGHGSGIYVSKALADKNEDEASRYVSSAFFLGGAIGIIILTFGLIFLGPFMQLLGSTDTILPYAMDYGMWILISAPFLIMSLIINNNLRYEGKAFYAMFGLIAGSLLNILGDYIFIQLCGLGVYGAGLSTAISQMISFVLLLIFDFKFAQGKIRFKYISKNIKLYWDIIRTGFPSFVRQAVNSLSNGVLNHTCKPYGDEAMAAMSIVGRYSSFVMCVGIGIGQGMQPISSFNYRIKRYDRVKQSVIYSILFGCLFVGILSAFGIFMPDTLIRLFQQKNPEPVVEIGRVAMIVTSIGEILIPIALTCNMIYQSIRKSLIASFISMLRSGLIYIPAILILNATMGLDGIKIAQCIADVLASLISIPFLIILFKKFNDESKELDDNNIISNTDLNEN